VLGFGWTVLLPASAITAVILNRRTLWLSGWWINGVVLVLWALVAGLYAYVILSGAFPSIVR
jgi:hypothetical protein